MTNLNPDNQESYDKFADHYEKATSLIAPSFYGKNPKDLELIERIIDRLYNDLFNKENHWRLELGCGTGRLTIPIITQGYRMLGIEYSKEMLRKLKQKVNSLSKARKKNLLIINSDVKEIENQWFQNRIVKIIIAPWSFLHSFSIADQSSLLRKLHGILDPGGAIIDFDAYQIFWDYKQLMNNNDASRVQSRLLLEKPIKLGEPKSI